MRSVMLQKIITRIEELKNEVKTNLIDFKDLDLYLREVMHINCCTSGKEPSEKIYNLFFLDFQKYFCKLYDRISELASNLDKSSSIWDIEKLDYILREILFSNSSNFVYKDFIKKIYTLDTPCKRTDWTISYENILGTLTEAESDLKPTDKINTELLERISADREIAYFLLKIKKPNPPMDRILPQMNKISEINLCKDLAAGLYRRIGKYIKEILKIKDVQAKRYVLHSLEQLVNKLREME
ncbi:MAG: hypothetical protein N2749_01895 [Clostridia bacterium]|nr:hypothetical protein [Clostridia bacterium]